MGIYKNLSISRDLGLSFGANYGSRDFLVVEKKPRQDQKFFRRIRHSEGVPAELKIDDFRKFSKIEWGAGKGTGDRCAAPGGVSALPELPPHRFWGRLRRVVGGGGGRKWPTGRRRSKNVEKCQHLGWSKSARKWETGAYDTESMPQSGYTKIFYDLQTIGFHLVQTTGPGTSWLRRKNLVKVNQIFAGFVVPRVCRRS